MKKVVHSLTRNDFSILVEVVIENLITKNDYRSSLVPPILLKHWKDLLPKDQIRLINNIQTILEGTPQEKAFLDNKYWENFLNDIRAIAPEMVNRSLLKVASSRNINIPQVAQFYVRHASV